jgi:hypothetical protein
MISSKTCGFASDSSHICTLHIRSSNPDPELLNDRYCHRRQKIALRYKHQTGNVVLYLGDQIRTHLAARGRQPLRLNAGSWQREPYAA